MSFAYSIINIYSSSSSNSSSQRMYKPPPTFAAAAAAAVAANKVRLCVISPCIDCRLRSRALGSRLYMKRERERGGLIVSAAAALLQSSSLLLLASFFSLFFFFLFSQGAWVDDGVLLCIDSSSLSLMVHRWHSVKVARHRTLDTTANLRFIIHRERSILIFPHLLTLLHHWLCNNKCGKEHPARSFHVPFMGVGLARPWIITSSSSTIKQLNNWLIDWLNYFVFCYCRMRPSTSASRESHPVTCRTSPSRASLALPSLPSPLWWQTSCASSRWATSAASIRFYLLDRKSLII